MAADIYKAVVRARLAGIVEVRNVFYVQVEANASLAVEIATWLAGVYTPIDSYISNQFVIYGLDLYILQSGHWVLNSENAFNHAGGSNTEFSPYQVAAVLVARTIVPRCLPKKFFAGFTEGAIDSGSLVTGALIALAAAGSAWIAPFTGGTSAKEYTPGTYSDKHEEFIAFNGVLVNLFTGTQRRRKPNVGI